MQANFDFLSNGGDMGALMRAKDWSASALGHCEAWPALLKSTIRLILTSRHPMFLWWGPQLIQFYNDAYRDTMGPERHPGALGGEGRRCWEEIWPIIGPQITMVMAGQGSTWNEDQLVPVTRHGRREDVWWTYGYSPIEDQEGVQGVLVVCNDVTADHIAKAELERMNRALTEQIAQREAAQQQQAIQIAQRLQVEQALRSTREDGSMARQALHRSELRLMEGMTLARMVVWDWDLHTNQVSFSDNAAALFGAVWSHMPAVWKWIDAGDLQRLDAERQAALRCNGVYGDTIRLIRPDNGQTVWLQVHGTVVPGADGKPKCIRGVSIDVSARKRAEESLREAGRHKDEFLAMLSHELRNPLAPIRSAAHLLGMAPDNVARVRQSSVIIERQVNHMTSLIDDLLDVSRVNTGLVVLDKEVVDMHQIVVESVEQTQPLILEKGHTLSVHAPGEGEAAVLGDRKRLVQVLTNLLHNAAKYTPAGGHITLRISHHAGMVELHVSDDGIGVDAELMPHIFELFTQEKRASDRTQGGLGLGLALVHSLVLLHGGHVTAASEGPGAGATFSVYLPRLGPQRPGASAGGRDHAAGGQALRLLVVDDNQDAANALAMLLEMEGHAVAVEHEPQTALARAAEFQPDACLLDIGLPGMDGYELARRLRAGAATRSAALIAITGYGNKYGRETTVSAGFDHYFVKPARTAELIAVLAGIRPQRYHEAPAPASRAC